MVGGFHGRETWKLGGALSTYAHAEGFESGMFFIKGINIFLNEAGQSFYCQKVSHLFKHDAPVFIESPSPSFGGGTWK